MKHFLKLYATFIAQYFKRLLEYRIDFLTGAFSFLFDQVTSLVFIFIIFNQIPALSGYPFEAIVFIYGFSLIPKGIDHFLTDNLWKVAYFMVRNGSFDRYLTRPIHPLLHVIMETWQIDALGEFLVGMTLVLYSSSQGIITWMVSDILLLPLTMIMASLIYTSIKMMVSAIALWTKRSGSILQMVYSTNEFAKYPIAIYHRMIQFTITYVIPFAFTSYFPARYFMTRENPWGNIGGLFLLAVTFTSFGVYLWQIGLRAYESAGS